jgi:hypothetical protein
MKVFLNREGRLRTITKTFLKGPALGEMTGVSVSPPRAAETLTCWRSTSGCGIQGYVADALCVYHRKWELAFHPAPTTAVSRSISYDLTRARRSTAVSHPSRLSG